LVVPLSASLHGFRLALRHWRRAPGFFAIAAAVLALGIGSTTALFTVVHRVVLEPLPFERPEQLITLRSTVTAMGWERIGVSEPLYLDLADQLSRVSDVAAFFEHDATIDGNGDPVRVPALRASADLLDVLRVRPAFGRFFAAAEDVSGGPHVAVLSHAFWQQRFGGASDVIGTTMLVDEVSHEIIGVLPREFSMSNRPASVYLPLSLPPGTRENLSRRGSHNLTVLARLHDNVPTLQGQAALAAFNQWLADEHGDFYRPAFGFSVEMTRLEEEVAAGSTSALALLAGATALVLLIACANVANLLLARNENRRSEFALRLALGAGHRNLLWSITLESAVLAVGAGLLGLVFAQTGLAGLIAAFGPAIPRAGDIGINPAALAFAFTIATATCLLVGVVPALRMLRLRAGSVLKEDARGGSGTRTRSRTRATIAIAEIALAFTLIVGAGLWFRSLSRVLAVDPGFESAGVAVVPVLIPALRYEDVAHASAFYEQLAERVSAIPGAVAAGAIEGVPLRDPVAEAAFRPGTTFRGSSPEDVAPAALRHVVTPGYIEAARLRLIEGRSFDASDRPSALPVVVINQELARRHWPGEQALGRQLVAFGDAPRTVIGVLQDVRNRSLTRDPEPELYFPASQMGVPRRDMRLVVASLMGVFALLALLLGAIGVYSVLAYTFELRRREVAIRMAVGATPADVRQLVLAAGLQLGGIGIGMGMITAAILATLSRASLFEVSPLDPTTFAVATATLGVSALVASWVPSRRALRLNPGEALRG
jgi:putative ABC transport system permease protein